MNTKREREKREGGRTVWRPRMEDRDGEGATISVEDKWRMRGGHVSPSTHPRAERDTLIGGHVRPRTHTWAEWIATIREMSMMIEATVEEEGLIEEEAEAIGGCIEAGAGSRGQASSSLVLFFCSRPL
jgi:hypothetical protein